MLTDRVLRFAGEGVAGREAFRERTGESPKPALERFELDLARLRGLPAPARRMAVASLSMVPNIPPVIWCGGARMVSLSVSVDIKLLPDASMFDNDEAEDAEL